MLHEIEIGTEEKYERCVLCRRDMSIRVSADLDTRPYYMEGCGQLCPSCYTALREGSEQTKLSLDFGRRRQPVRLKLGHAH